MALDIYEREILRTLQKSRVPLNTSQISEKTDISWNTTKDRLEELYKKRKIKKKDKGNEILWNA